MSRKKPNLAEPVYPWETKTFRAAWQNWKQYKHEEFAFKYKSVLSEQAALKKLWRLAHADEQTAIEIIEQSMADRWEGLYKLKQDGSKYNSTKPSGRAGQQYQSLDAIGSKLLEDIRKLAADGTEDTSGA